MSTDSMTPTHVRTDAPSRTTTKVAALASAAVGVFLFMTVAAINVPHDPTDAELVKWWADSGNRISGVVSAFSAIGVAIAVAVVLNYLRSLPAAQRSPQWLAFASSMGTAVSATWLVTGAARGTIGHLVDVMDESLPGPDVLRFVTGFNYTLLGLCGMAVLGLAIGAISVVVLRTDVLAHWVGVVGAICAVLILLATVAQYGALASPISVAWAFCLAVAIWRQPAAS